MKLSELASDMAAAVLAAGGFVKSCGRRVNVEVEGVTWNLMVWWMNQRYPIQPRGIDAYTLFYEEMTRAGKSQNCGAVSCALDCGCGGNARSRLFRRLLFRKLGR